MNQTVYFDESGEELVNPLIGYAPSAEETSGHGDASLGLYRPDLGGMGARAGAV